jgi:hypothetical protein
MKRLLRIFELTKNEQRVVLLVMLVLVVFAFVGYERRIHYLPVRARSVTEPRPSPSPSGTEDEQ